MAVHLAVICDVFDCVIYCAVLFSNEMSLMRSGIELSQFLFTYLLLFHPKSVINLLTLILTKQSFLFWVVRFSVLPLTGFSFLNLLDLLECLVM